MHTVIIADESFARREHAMLSRLEVGLADEGVRVTHAIPQTVLAQAPTDQFGIQSTTVGYREAALPFTHRTRGAELLRAIDAAREEPTPIDVVHAFGAGSWSVAFDVARRAGASLLLELWRPGLIVRAAALVGAARRTGSAVAPEFIASESSVIAALRKRMPQAKAYSAPWGVHAPESPRPASGGDRALAVAVLCDTGDVRRVMAALTGLTRVASSVPELLVFACVDTPSSSREAALWAGARRLGLLDRFTIVPEMEARREPILRMDMLLLPEATGRQRTITLDAMGAGMSIVATPDPYLETLADGVTAKLVTGTQSHGAPSAAAWADAVRSLATDRAAAGALNRTAHQYVRSERTAAAQVAAVLKAYQLAARPASGVAV